MIYERHRILSELLISLGVPEDIATQDACRIEHVLSKETFEASNATSLNKSLTNKPDKTFR